MKAITLEDQIEHAKEIIEMYRNSWFVPKDPRIINRTPETRLRFAGDPENWRNYLQAQAILRSLRLLKRLRQ